MFLTIQFNFPIILLLLFGHYFYKINAYNKFFNVFNCIKRGFIVIEQIYFCCNLELELSLKSIHLGTIYSYKHIPSTKEKYYQKYEFSKHILKA